MIKIQNIYSLLLLFLLLLPPTFTYGSEYYSNQQETISSSKWIAIKNGDKLTLFSDGLLVRNDIPSENNRVRTIAKLPKNITVTVKKLYSDWTNIEWYSTTEKKIKHGWVATVQLQSRAGKHISLEKSLNQAFKNLSDAERYMNEMQVSMKEKKYDDVIAWATNAISAFFICEDTSPGTFNHQICAAYALRGMAYSMLNNEKNAIADITEAMHYDKDMSPNLYYIRGLAYEKAGYYSKAKADYLIQKRKALAIKNEKTVIMLNERIQHLDKLLQKAK